MIKATTVAIEAAAASLEMAKLRYRSRRLRVSTRRSRRPSGDRTPRLRSGVAAGAAWRARGRRGAGAVAAEARWCSRDALIVIPLFLLGGSAPDRGPRTVRPDAVTIELGVSVAGRQCRIPLADVTQGAQCRSRSSPPVTPGATCASR